MERKRKEVGKVISQKELAPGIFDMWIETHLAQQAAPGQFVMIYPRAESTILPRPISICQVEKEAGRLRIVYRVAGKGTGEFAGYRAGEGIALMGTRADLLEINVSCPNVKEGAIAFGQNADCLYDITSQIKQKARQPVIMKLSPNVTDIGEMARAAEAAGADALSLINTLTGMKIDIARRTFALANRTGGLSGPAIKPVAVRMVYECAHAVRIPIIGMGGITSGEDAIEFLMAGATAVSVGAANFADPCATIKVLEGMENWMRQNGITDIHEIIGCVQS